MNPYYDQKDHSKYDYRVDKFWYTQDIEYDFEAPLRTTNNRTGTRDLMLVDYENEELITESYSQKRPKVRYYHKGRN